METSPDLSTPGQQSEGSYLQKLLSALQLIRGGDFSVRIPGDNVGIEGKIVDTLNEIVAANQQMAQQLELVGQVVGREGKTRKRVVLGLPQGAWREMEESINTLIDDLLWPTAQVTGAIAAVAKGDLLKKVGFFRRERDGESRQRSHLRNVVAPIGQCLFALIRLQFGLQCLRLSAEIQSQQGFPVARRAVS